jgi:Raf kinase inhibitor-like YbhB/YbcL family protein
MLHDRPVLALLASVLLLLAVACGSDSNADGSTAVEEATQPLQISSDAFESGGQIPRKFTCDGADVSPRLFWTAVGQGRELALIMDDPDGGDFVHWVVYGLPVTTREFPEAVVESGDIRSGINDFGNSGYGGPCPPEGSGPHQYDFTLFSLSGPIDLPAGATADELRSAMEGKILQDASYSGFYER